MIISNPNTNILISVIIQIKLIEVVFHLCVELSLIVSLEEITDRVLKKIRGEKSVIQLCIEVHD